MFRVNVWARTPKPGLRSISRQKLAGTRPTLFFCSGVRPQRVGFAASIKCLGKDPAQLGDSVKFVPIGL
jgi:hypothetical protein